MLPSTIMDLRQRFPTTLSHSVIPLPFPGFPGRRPRDQGLAGREQVPGRRERRLETTGTPDDDQGEAAGDPEVSVQSDAEAHAAYSRTARQGDWSTNEGYTGKSDLETNFELRIF